MSESEFVVQQNSVHFKTPRTGGHRHTTTDFVLCCQHLTHSKESLTCSCEDTLYQSIQVLKDGTARHY